MPESIQKSENSIKNQNEKFDEAKDKLRNSQQHQNAKITFKWTVSGE